MKSMEKDKPEPQVSEAEDMLPEYDFRGGTRGKHARSYRQGHTVKIHRSDGTTKAPRFE